MAPRILAILIEPIKHELNLSGTQAGLLYGFTFAAFFALACHYSAAVRALRPDLEAVDGTRAEFG